MPTEIKAYCAETGEYFGCNPARDVAWFMPKLMEDLLKRLDRGVKDEEFLQRFRTTEVEVRLAAACLSQCIGTAGDADIKSIADGAVLSGLMACPRGAKDAVLSLFGATCVGAAWAGCRDSSIVGNANLSSLRRRGAEAVLAMYDLLISEPSEAVVLPAMAQLAQRFLGQGQEADGRDDKLSEGDGGAAEDRRSD